MDRELIRLLDTLGSVRDYRTPDRVAEVWSRLEAAMDLLRREFLAIADARERNLYGLRVIEMVLEAAKARASFCELCSSSGEMACENLDCFELLSEWIKFMKAEG